MGYLYADATNSYSDPAKSGHLHMMADGTWAKPDMSHKWLDARNDWSVPALRPASLAAATPDQVAAIAAEVKAGSGDYDSWVGQQTAPISFGSYGTTTFTLVGVNHQDQCTIGNSARPVNPQLWPLVLMADSAFGPCVLASYATCGWGSEDLSDGSNGAHEYLKLAYNSMDAQWRAIVSEASYPDIGAYILNQWTGEVGATHLFPPTLYEMNAGNTAYGPNVGQPLAYFRSHSGNSYRVRRKGSSAVRWMTRTPNGSDTSGTNRWLNVMAVSTSGAIESVSVTTSMYVTPLMVIGA